MKIALSCVLRTSRNLRRHFAQIDADQIVDRERETLPLPDGRQHRRRHRHKECGRAQPPVGDKSEIDEGDAEEDRNAIGDDHEHPRVAVVRLIEEMTLRTALMNPNPAPEEISLATARTSTAQSAAEHLANSRPI